jgi:hypothetical protein
MRSRRPLERLGVPPGEVERFVAADADPATKDRAEAGAFLGSVNSRSGLGVRAGDACRVVRAKIRDSRDP